MPKRNLPTRIRAGVIIGVVLACLAAVPAAQAALPEYRGVMLHSLWFDSTDADMDRELDLAASAGSNVVRVDVVWGSLETGGKGQYSPWYLAKLDRFVTGAQARGMKVLPTLWSSPCWASSAPENVKQGCAGSWWDRGVGAYPPANPADYGDIARFITGRYGSKLAALEVWNEPNLDGGWFWKTSDPAGDYARLLKGTYARAKAGNSQVPVLAGAMAYADRPFLDQLNANGINGYHDGISVHPYNEWRAPADRWRAEWKKYTLLPGIEWIREGQQAAGDDTPIWVTEFGWTTGTASGWRVTETQQASFVGDSFGLMGNLPYVRGATVYNLREKGTDPASHEDNFGLVNRDFTPKPAYAALRTALAGPSTPPGGGGGEETPPGGGGDTPPGGGGGIPPLPQGPPAGPVSPPPVASSGGPAAAPATGRPRPVSNTGRVTRRITLRLKRRRGRVAAVGTAPPLSRLRLSFSSCTWPSAHQAITLRASSSGRFVRRLGTKRRLKGCRVTVRLINGRAAAARRI